MCRFLSFYPNPTFVLVKGKNLGKYEVFLKLKQGFILMIEEKTFVDFMIIEIQIFSFGGFYLNKI